MIIGILKKYPPKMCMKVNSRLSLEYGANFAIHRLTYDFLKMICLLYKYNKQYKDVCSVLLKKVLTLVE